MLISTMLSEYFYLGTIITRDLLCMEEVTILHNIYRLFTRCAVPFDDIVRTMPNESRV
ncbi:ankyrin-like protein [Variola virus]|uniref:Ankyrin-like protein n=1 Tax=Variola virus TaxID=10255 RepID=Q0N5H5_VARV|nr:ankyrin-like protein [Variola virus]ABG56227.1 ankyrin-like protein [Variola virus]ABU92033.1 hypothetical protein Brazil_131_R13 [Variola virus]ABU92089.1 hypothetical protein Ind-3a_R10 [Variola virus]ABU92102.1 hypothetical protein Ind-4a_R10 [Variola virus]